MVPCLLGAKCTRIQSPSQSEASSRFHHIHTRWCVSDAWLASLTIEFSSSSVASCRGLTGCAGGGSTAAQPLSHPSTREPSHARMMTGRSTTDEAPPALV